MIFFFIFIFSFSLKILQHIWHTDWRLLPYFPFKPDLFINAQIQLTLSKHLLESLEHHQQNCHSPPATLTQRSWYFNFSASPGALDVISFPNIWQSFGSWQQKATLITFHRENTCIKKLGHLKEDTGQLKKSMHEFLQLSLPPNGCF